MGTIFADKKTYFLTEAYVNCCDTWLLGQDIRKSSINNYLKDVISNLWIQDLAPCIQVFENQQSPFLTLYLSF